MLDGEVGWVGGAGFEDHFNGGRYHDVYARITDDVLRQMQLVFLTSFHVLGGPDPESDPERYFPKPRERGVTPVTLLHNVPGGFLPGTQSIGDTIEGAEERLGILNPYLTDPGILDPVLEAGRCGVDVTVVVPGDSNVPQASAALAHHYGDLCDAGVEVFEHEEIVHSKGIVADDTVVIGTINLDAWALYRNNEIALLIEDADLAEDARQVMAADALARSEPAELLEGRRERLEAWFWDKLVYFL